MPPVDPNQPSQPDPVGYLLTWTVFGTWLPGDTRGWIRRNQGNQAPDDIREKYARKSMLETDALLESSQRKLVEDTIRAHCIHRGWELHAVNCRSNHVHVVVSASAPPKVVLQQLKAWTARKLNELGPQRNKWWTERGSGRYLNCQKSLEAAVVYVIEGQDRK